MDANDLSIGGGRDALPPADAISRRTRMIYDEIAPEYAAQDVALRPWVVHFGELFLTAAGPAGRVLEVGCGPGRDMAWLEAQGARVIGADLSAGMLAQARSRVQGGLAQMDMRRLAFPVGAFAGVWCDAALLHLPKAAAPLALAEFRRVLMPAGTLFVALQEGSGEGWEAGRFGAVERFFARYDADEVAALLHDAGFVVREQQRSQSGPRTWLQLLATAG